MKGIITVRRSVGLTYAFFVGMKLLDITDVRKYRRRTSGEEFKGKERSFKRSLVEVLQKEVNNE